MAIELTNVRVNPYERLKTAAASKTFFTEGEWRTSVANGTAEQYYAALSKMNNEDVNEFYKKYNLYYGDPKTRLSALYNEAMEVSNKKLGIKQDLKPRKIPKIDNSGNYVYDENDNVVYDEPFLSDYEYNLKMISDANALYSAGEYQKQLEEQRENNKNFLADVVVILDQAGTAAHRSVENMLSLGSAGLDWLFIKDTDFAERLNYYTQNVYNSAQISQEQLDQFAYNYSHFYNEKGEMEDVGRWLIGISDTIGQMLPTIAVTYATAGLGSAIGASSVGSTAIGSQASTFLTTHANAIGQASFYAANVFTAGVSEDYENYVKQGISIPSSQILEKNLLKTTLQWGVEKGLAWFLGATGIDNLFWGTSTKSNVYRFSSKNLTANAFLRLGKDALQEGLEEALQDTSDFFVDKAYEMFINENFGSVQWDWQNIADSFIIGALTSIVGDSARMLGTKRITTGNLKTDSAGNLVKDKNGDYEFEKLGKIASYEYSLDLQSYMESVDAILAAGEKMRKMYDSSNSKKFEKAASQFSAAYYQMVGSFKLLSGIYGQIGKERFNKANEILSEIRKMNDAGKFDMTKVKSYQEFAVSNLEITDEAIRAKALVKMAEANMTSVETTIEQDTAVDENDGLSVKAKALLESLKSDGVTKVCVTSDGNRPVLADSILFIPKNLLKNFGNKVVMASIVEQELADKMTEAVVNKSRYFKNEINIVTELYRQWTNSDTATTEDAIYALIFDTRFFEIVLAINEDATSSFALRLNSIVSNISNEKTFKNTMLITRIDECRKRWIEAAFNYYSNNLQKDTSLFTKNLSSEERKNFDKRLDRLLQLYNMGSQIISDVNNVPEEVWSFVERRIDGLDVDKNRKDELKRDIRDNNAKTRQTALNYINVRYNGMFNTLYNGKVYMPKTSVANFAFNSWLETIGLTIDKLFNDQYLNDQERAFLGDSYTLEDLIALRVVQFEEIRPGMSFEVNSSGNIVVRSENTDDGFGLYKDVINQNLQAIEKGESFEIGGKTVERTIATDLSNFSKLIKNYLNSDVLKDKGNEWLTIDDIINHPEYLNDATIEDIKNQYGNLDKVSCYRYFQNQICSDSDGKQSLLIKQDGTVVIGNMTAMSEVHNETEIPDTGTFTINKFVRSKYLTGTLADVKVVLKNDGKTRYVDYEMVNGVMTFVNTIYVNTKIYNTQEEREFALLHEFQHAIQSENKLNIGTTGNILQYFNAKEKQEIIDTVKELSPELFEGVTKQKTIEKFVENYIYHASGEFQAMGLGGIGQIGFYPVIISRENGITKITFKNGKSFEIKAAYSIVDIQNSVIDQSKEIINKNYSKYDVEQDSVMNFMKKVKALQSLKSELGSRNRTKSDELLEMYYLFNSNKTQTEFENSKVIGIEINGHKYTLKSLRELEYLIVQIFKDSRVTDSKISMSLFSYKPKDLKSFRPLNENTVSYSCGEIEIDKSYTSDRRNVLVNFDQVAKEITEQSLLYEKVSEVTGEVLYDYDDLNDIYHFKNTQKTNPYFFKQTPLDVDFIRDKQVPVSETIDLVRYKLIDWSDVEREFKLSKGEVDTLKTIAKLYDIDDQMSREFSYYLDNDDVAYKYFVEAVVQAKERAAESGTNVTLPNSPILNNEEKSQLLKNLETSDLREKMLRLNYEKFNLIYPEVSFSEYLELYYPVVRLSTSNELQSAPFVSAVKIENQDRSEVDSIVSLRDSSNLYNTLFFGEVKIKDILFFSPALKNEIFVKTDVFTDQKTIGELGENAYGFTYTFLDNPYQELSEDSDRTFATEQEDKPSVDVTGKTSDTTNKRRKVEGKVIDRRSKSERKTKFNYNSKKYEHSRTALGDSKNATRVITSKDIGKDVAESGRPITTSKGGKYAYREFVERRYYLKSDGSEGYKDIFDYYTVKEKRRHTLKSESENTNLKYFTTNKGKSQITMSPGLREFVIASTDVEIDPVIMSKIKSGKLTGNDLLNYVIETPTDKIDNVTFRLILKTMYDNDVIKSKAQLDDIALNQTAKMTALYFVLKDTQFEDLLYRELKDGDLDKIWDFVSSQKNLSKELNRLYVGASSGLNHSLKTFDLKKMSEYLPLDAEVLTKESLYKTIKFYKGDIASGSQALVRARQATFKDGLTVGTGYQASRFGQTSKYSLDKSIRQNAKTTFLDQVTANENTPDADVSFDYDYNDMLRELTDVESDLGRKVFTILSQKIMQEHNNDYTFTKKSLTKYMTNLANLSEEQVVSLYRRMLGDLDEESLSKLYFLAELPGFENVVIENDYTREQKVESVLNKVINYGSKVQGIKRKVNTIKKYVTTTKGKNLLLSENSDIFDENLNLKVDSYRQKQGYKPIELINELSKRVSAISKAARAGAYFDQGTYNGYLKKLENNQKSLEKIYKTITKQQSKGVIKGVSISNEDGNINVKVKGTAEVPKTIRQILSVGLTRTDRSKIQELASYHERYNEDGSVDKVYDDRYLKLTMTDLLRKNAELFNNLSQDEAEEILEFYVSNDVILSDVDSQIVSETVRLVVAYLLGESRYSQERYGEGFERFDFNESLIKRVEAKMIDQTHLSAAMLSNQRTIIRLLRPNEIIAQEIGRHLGFKLDDVDKKNLGDMLTCMRTGTEKQYKEAKERFQSKLIKDYPNKSKQDVVDKLLTFERAMMLSNPGTWLRNIASNYVVEGSNIASHKVGKTVTDLVMKMFPKIKEKIESLPGYKLDRKASDETVDFINKKFVDSGLLDETLAGVSKYDDLSKHESSSDNIVDMIARSIYRNLANNQVFAEGKKVANVDFGKLGNKIVQLVYKAVNDDPWIKRATKRYLGQIIEEDYQKAKAKNKNLTYDQYLADDKTNLYGLSENVISAFVKAANLASYDYMKTSNFITQMERAIRENVPRGAWFIYKQVFSFLASSWNWCVEGMRYTPLGLADAIVKLARLENTIAKMDDAKMRGKSVVSGEFAKYLQIRNIGKGTIGTLTFAIGMLLYGLGWAGIDDDDDEYKLFVGDVKININDVLGSQGVMLGIAIAHNITNEGKDVVDVFSEAFNQLFRDSIFQDFIDTFRYNTGFGDFMWTTMWDIPTQFWPNLLKTVASIVHRRGVTYSDDELVARLQKLFVKNVPLPEQFVGANTKVNPYTGETESFFSGEFFTDIFSRYSPVKITYPSVDTNETISIGLGIKKSQLTGNYTIDEESVKLNAEERTKLNTLYGKLNGQKLTKFYNNSLKVKVKTDNGKYKELAYSQMNDEQKKAAVNNLMSNNSSLSKIYILTSTGRYKYYANESEYKELKNLGINKNVYKKTDDKSGFYKIN